MPNSPWTETGSSISLVPSTIAIGSSPENVDYLTNPDKIALMAQYSAELAIKTQLDTTAGGLGVPTANYDNAVAAINTTLVNAGAPSNWATIWPDGTTSGPWTGIQTTLATDWSGIASARTSLQSAISATQASVAKAAAFAAAASESLIPNGAFSTGDMTGWVATDGGAGGAGVFGALPDGSQGVTFAGGVQSGAASPSFQVIPGKKYKLIFWAYAGAGTQTPYFRVRWKATQADNITSANADGSQDFLTQPAAIGTAATFYAFDWTPSGTELFASLAAYEWGGAAPIYLKGVYCIPYLEAGYVDAGAVTADLITTGTLDASQVNVTNLNASNITTGTLAADKVTFPDGSQLTTAGVQTSVANQSGNVTNWAGGAEAISGLAYTFTAAGPGDVVNIIASLPVSVSGAGTVAFGVYVDGALVSNTGSLLYMQNGQLVMFPFFASISGLAAGSHTLQIYCTESPAYATTVGPSSRAMFQRIF